MGSIVPRILSLLVTGMYVAVGFDLGGVGDVVWAVLYCLVPVACIWFPREMSQLKGLRALTDGHVSRESHPGCLAGIAWVILLLPLAAIMIKWIAL